MNLFFRSYFFFQCKRLNFSIQEICDPHIQPIEPKVLGGFQPKQEK